MYDGEPVGIDRTVSRFGHKIIHQPQEGRGQEEGYGIVAVPPLYQGILYPGVYRVTLKGRYRKLQAVEDMEHSNGDNCSQVKPDRHIEMALPPSQQGRNKVPAENDPNHCNGDIDGPFQLRIFFGSGISQREGDGCRHDDQLPAPEINIGEGITEHPGLEQALGGIIHPGKNRIPHKGKYHGVGVQGPQPSEAKPGDPVREVWKQKHKGQQEAYQHPDDAPQQGRVEEFLDDFVVVMKLLNFHENRI